MIRPVRFGYNAQTAVNNAFQLNAAKGNVQEKALIEFDRFVEMLRDHDIDVLVVQDTEEPHTPDSIFPNNWISFHDDGTVVLYPMFAANRRLERKESVFKAINDQFIVREQIDYTENEMKGKFLEGTGSFVLDRQNKIAYACSSPRTDEALFMAFCEQMGYKPVVFEAIDSRGIPIYHTNVMMCIADEYVVICLDSIQRDDLPKVMGTLERSGKAIVPITVDQVAHFTGNMLQVVNRLGERFLIMSSSAYRALDAEQLTLLESYNRTIHSPLDTIEQNGGGSARCMMAEVFLPVNSNGLQ